MNKTKIILASVGGVFGLAAIALVVLIVMAMGAKTAALEGDDETEGLEGVVAKAESLSRKGVYPCAASVKAITSNETLVATWQKEATTLAARGDRVFETTTPAAFKAFLVTDAKRLSELPGRVDGKIMKSDFAFGPFKGYITEGVMPAESQLKTLQRNWDDVATLVETLAACGVAELTDVKVKGLGEGNEVKAEADANAGNDRRAKNRAKNKANNKSKSKAKLKNGEDDDKEPVVCSYTLTFSAKPAQFVKVLNALETCERFVTVTDFSFGHKTDTLGEALGGEKKKSEEPAATGRRGRRRGRAAEAEQKTEQPAEEGKNGVVTDPIQDAPLEITLQVTVTDYRSLEEKGESK